jgi:hypothetical protein
VESSYCILSTMFNRFCPTFGTSLNIPEKEGSYCIHYNDYSNNSENQIASPGQGRKGAGSAKGDSFSCMLAAARRPVTSRAEIQPPWPAVILPLWPTVTQ